MMRTPDPFGKIAVTAHVLERVRERLQLGGTDDEALAFAIRGEIRSSLLHDRLGRTRPNWVRFNRQEADLRHDGSWYVWDREVSRCWVLMQGGATTVVITLLLNVDDRHTDGALHHLRAGLRYAS